MMTREDNGDTVARYDSTTGQFFIYCRETGRRWALRDTVNEAWADFYDDLNATWPQWAPVKETTTDETAQVREPAQEVAA